MEFGSERFAIMKAVNYKDSSFEKIKRHVDYILDKNKSPEQYQQGWNVDAKDALNGLDIIYKHYNPKGNRHFKHWIVSFGVPDLNAADAFAASKDIASYYAKEYPVILGLHTNIPSRLHCHFLQNTVNVHTGKKFSQSNAEFADFRKYINKVLAEYSLPLLRGVKPSAQEQTPRKDVDGDSVYIDDSDWTNNYTADVQNYSPNGFWPYQGYYCPPIMQQPVYPIAAAGYGQPGQQNPVENLMKTALEGIMACYEMGRQYNRGK